MAFQVLLLASSVLLLAKETLGAINCETRSFMNCRRPQVPKGLPGEISDFRIRCQRTTTYMRCLKDYQDECGWDSVGLYSSPDILEAYFNTVSELCEEGTSLNTVATENLQCFKETFSKTKCVEEAGNDSAAYLNRRFQEAEFEPQNIVDLDCLNESLKVGCILLAISENCGKPVGDATLEIIRRLKILENVCSGTAARLVLNELESFDLSEVKKQTLTLLLEKPAEPNRE